MTSEQELQNVMDAIASSGDVTMVTCPHEDKNRILVIGEAQNRKLVSCTALAEFRQTGTRSGCMKLFRASRGCPFVNNGQCLCDQQS